MADMGEIAISAGGGGVGVFAVMKLLAYFAHDKAQTLQASITALQISIKEQAAEFKQTLAEVSREMRSLRDTDIRQAEQIGSMQKDIERSKERTDELAKYWRERFESPRGHS